MKKIDVASLSLENKVQTLEHIFDNMHAKSVGLGQAGFILGGDTGVGKTSFIRDLAALLGLELIMIETPHIVEEHIIDIPFIVVTPAGGKKTEHVMVDTKNSQQQFDVKFAKSHLYTSLASAKKDSDAALLAAVNRRGDLKQIWEQLGGTDKRIPAEINEIRSKYDVILFLDEYFRQTSSAIRNMLRSILNGRIGASEIPSNAYVIFASNLVDQGIGDILENEDFKLLNFDKPTVDEWFAYMLAKYKNSPKVKLNDELLDATYDLMKKHDALSYDDEDTDVRISPRRWEQLLTYISANLPVKDQRQADLLLKNVETSFKHYQTGENAKIASEMLDIIKNIIKDESDISASEASVDDSDWRETLKHQIESKMKLGDVRKYVPVIAGPPGAGKTKHISQVALELNLIPVFVDVQNLSPEEVIGIPLSKDGTPVSEKTGDTGDIEVTFSRPPLYDNILQQMKLGEKRLPEALTKAFGADEAKKRLAQFKKQDFKYLIFFDELNRTSTKVFNAIRKVLLEKEFADEYKLPPESVIVAAINPTGRGVQELTKHVRDVFDVIPVGVSWHKFTSHLNTVDLEVEPEVSQIARAVLSSFVERFRAKKSAVKSVDPHFYLQIGSSPIYMSPREYTDMLVGISRAAQRAYSKEMELLADPDADLSESELKIRKAIARAMVHSIEYIAHVKHGVESPDFIKDLTDWVLYTDEFSLGSIFKRKVESVKKLEDLLAKPFETMDSDLFNDVEFVNYIASVDPVVFKEDLAEFLVNYVVKDVKTALAKTHKLKTLDVKKKKSTIQDEEVSKIEFITREIIHAIKLHDVSNKMLEMVREATRDILEQLADKDVDLVDGIMDMSFQVSNYLTKMAAQK